MRTVRRIGRRTISTSLLSLVSPRRRRSLARRMLVAAAIAAPLVLFGDRQRVREAREV